MIKDVRGFFSIDALFAFLLLIAISTALLNAASSEQQIAEQTAEVQNKNMVVEKIAAAINSVYVNGSELTLTFSLPENIMETDYIVRGNSENRVIFAENSEEIARAQVIPKNFGNFELGPENLENKIQVYWKDDIILVKSK
ncbi:hypothetical protein AKJ50_00225 [candidate division MSBL1 archaeon SCGC-AAA382A13]|uniref:Uncharacterized protein n=1 Tax=candidate division MSBL1 archaeon SCGC-AAA382A13 TaxID=1698279 RepID=A0A133VGY1_9EURY|nr:hypothetical protein AKJ50_00225 [candidate division MSBL1 archaeon SCGC-AAA382A13]